MSKILIDPSDGLIVDDVGPWAKEKHERLKKFIDASRGARKKFLPPNGSGGAGYIELFSGPGRSNIRDTSDYIDGSPLVAYKAARQSNTRFSEIYLNDIDDEKSKAVQKRINSLGGSSISYSLSADIAVDRIVHAINPAGLHFAFLDPYKLEVMPFSVIEKLAALEHMDMLIHVSVFDLQRNLRQYIADGSVLDSFMPGWRGAVDANRTDQAVRTDLLNYWLSLIRKLGTNPAKGIELVSGPGGQRLYWLVFVSAHDLGQKLWDDVRNVSVQERLL